jgi:hypothetical protein
MGKVETWQPVRRGRRPDEVVARRAASAGRQPVGRKFMQTLDDHIHQELTRFAQERGVTVQGLIRAVIVPEWVNSQERRVSIFSNPQPVVVNPLPELKTRTVHAETGNSKAQLMVRR